MRVPSRARETRKRLSNDELLDVKVAALWILGLGLAAGNIYYWGLVMRGGDDWFRRMVERRYRIGIGKVRGFWQVSSGNGRLTDLGIELLQLVYFVGAFTVWAIGLLVSVAIVSWIGQ